MTDTQADVAADVDWNPRDIAAGDTVWVYEYYNGRPVRGTDGYDVRTSTGIVDAEGDMHLEPQSGISSFARKWRRPPTESKAVPKDEVWNPNNLERGTEVWVFEDSYYGSGAPRPDGFAVRTVANGTKDMDGEILLVASGLSGMGGYAKKWRLPETNLQPEVKPGDKVKVLGCLSGAQDYYREVVMNKVFVVADKAEHPGRGLIDGAILVELPEGAHPDGYSAGAIGQWAVVERAAVVDTEAEVKEAEPEVEPDWGAIIESWRTALNEYACDQEWCEEYESTVMRLFGWEPSRTVQYSVTVTLSNDVWLSTVVNLSKAFGSEYVELDDQTYTLEAEVTIDVSGIAGVAPTNEDVKRELEDCDYKFDGFTIVDWEINTDY